MQRTIKVTRPEPPADYWDNLTKTYASPMTIEKYIRDYHYQHSDAQGNGQSPDDLDAEDIKAFAERGGPNMQHVISMPKPKWRERMSYYTSKTIMNDAMIKYEDQRQTERSNKLYTHDLNFQQHLHDNHVYTDSADMKPPNLAYLDESRDAERDSSIDATFSSSDFEKLIEKHKEAYTYRELLEILMPALSGTPLLAGHTDVTFKKFKDLTNRQGHAQFVVIRPDYFDGSSLADLGDLVDQNGFPKDIIAPTALDVNDMVLPNFFVEVEDRIQEDSIAPKVCVTHCGAYAVRGMRALRQRVLQGNEDYNFDESVNWAFSSTYMNDVLTIYCHWSDELRGTGGAERDAYYMHKMGSYSLTATREEFIRGARAFRNIQDLAKRGRNCLIRALRETASPELTCNSKGMLNGGLSVPATEIRDEDDYYNSGEI